MPSSDAQTPDLKTRKAQLQASIIVFVGVLSVTLAQPQALGRIPIRNLLKNELHAGRAENAAFFFWIGLAWYFKPLAGIVTDAFPLLGTRRRSYVLIGATLATLLWAVLYFTPHQYSKLLIVSMVLDVFMVIASTAIGGYMVEVAQASGGSGRLASVFNFVQYLCILTAGPLGGYLAGIAFGWTTFACGCAMFLIVPTAFLLMREPRQTTDSRARMASAGKQLSNIFHAKMMWVAAAFMCLFYCAPGLTTAIFYKQQNDLHMTTQMQGNLQFLGGLFGMAAALIYGMYVCKRFQLRTLLFSCLLMGTLANLGYLFYTSVSRARVVESFNGFGYVLAELAMMDLAIRVTPPGSEGVGFSLMMSVRNLSLYGSDWAGSKLLDAYHLSFNTLVIANTVMTLAAVILTLLLPAYVVGSVKAVEPADVGTIGLEPVPVEE